MCKLDTLPTLRKLVLGENRFQDEGVRVLCQYLPNLVTLQGLEIDCVMHARRITSVEVVDQLGQSLAQCTNLLCLNIGDNFIDDEGFITLIRCISTLTSLQRLKVDRTVSSNLTENAFQTAVLWFAALTNLQLLSLDDGNLYYDHAMALIPLLSKLPCLEALCVNLEAIESLESVSSVFCVADRYSWALPSDSSYCGR